MFCRIALLLAVALLGCGNSMSSTDIDGGSAPDAASAADSGAGCVTDNDCAAGTCVGGQCCETLACGQSCCPDGDACLFNACVTPGAACVSAADCPAEHYCELALGETMPPGGGPTCTQPLQGGRCVALPPECEGLATDPPGCVQACEYVPQVGPLTAVIKWQWGYDPAPTDFAAAADVWSTPAVGRIADADCSGTVDLADPPNVVFVSSDSLTVNCNAASTNGACKKGVLRMLDGRNGMQVWSLDKAEVGSIGFSGVSVAIGDVDGDQAIEIAALTGEGKLAIVEADGTVSRLSTDIVDGGTHANFGWGGGLSIGDMDGDGWAEIAYGRTVFTMSGGTLSLLFKGTGGYGASAWTGISHFVDLDNDGKLELLAGNTAYTATGTVLWTAALGDAYTAVADFDGDNLPEVVAVVGGNVYVLEGATGAVEIGPHDIPGNGSGGPPTVADFNGDGAPEIGVAMQNFYSMMKPNYAGNTIADLWSTQNHDNSSSVTGSSVFDFQGDGKAEVVYADECFLWVYDGTTGDIIYTANTQSFTATESPVVADIDGDGHAEMLVVHNAANPNSWTCAHHTTGTDGYPVWSLPTAGAYRGVTVFGDSANSWVGTRTLWNQHAYSVSNICDPRDGACIGATHYGQIPTAQQKNWTVSWLNNFRQNVQDSGLFDAPDPAVSLSGNCATPIELEVAVRNYGRTALPAGVAIDVFVQPAATKIGTVTTTQALLPNQTEVIPFTVDPAAGTINDSYSATIYIDPVSPTFHECRPENNTSNTFTPSCIE